ncbi:MAG: YidH family protein [Erythrobacter sp.]
MSEKSNSNELAEERTDMAQERTDWAEDRTLMANERTFAGWMRTGLAAVGIGLGFNALFGKLEPYWLPRGIATLFICIGIFIFWAAQRNGCDVQDRMEAHEASPVRRSFLRLIAGAMAFASFCLAIGMWTIELPD